MNSLQYDNYSLPALFRGVSLPSGGKLIRLKHVDNSYRYACVQCWESLGDRGLKDLVEELRTGETHSSQAKSIFESLNIESDILPKLLEFQEKKYSIPRHRFINTADLAQELNQAKARGYKSIKMKLRKSFIEDDLWVQTLIKESKKVQLKLRLDGNSTLDKETFLAFWSDISEIHSYIDFIEDPVSYKTEDWHDLKLQGVPLAIDRPLDNLDPKTVDSKSPFSHLIFKPSRQPMGIWEEILKNCNFKICLTSSLDHELGQLWAFYWYQRLYETIPLKLVDTGFTSPFEDDPLASPLPFHFQDSLVCLKNVSNYFKYIEEIEWKNL